MVDFPLINGILLLVCYLIAVVVSAVITAYDKKQAIKGGWRVPESVLFTVSIIGCSLSMYITMHLVHHKTRHKRFMIGLPLIFIVKICLFVFIAFTLIKLQLVY